MIYLVDDEGAVANIMATALRNAGQPTTVFNDPLIALEQFRGAAVRPGLVISDFNMPGMNGLELLRQCKSIQPGLRTLSVSGNLTDEDMRKAGFRPDWVLPKPCALIELVEVAKCLLNVE